jgi:hypothetical protein
MFSTTTHTNSTTHDAKAKSQPTSRWRRLRLLSRCGLHDVLNYEEHSKCDPAERRADRHKQARNEEADKTLASGRAGYEPQPPNGAYRSTTPDKLKHNSREHAGALPRVSSAVRRSIACLLRTVNSVERPHLTSPRRVLLGEVSQIADGSCGCSQHGRLHPVQRQLSAGRVHAQGQRGLFRCNGD